MPPRSLLLTIDAFGTIFHPRLPVPEQYASTAHAFGLSPSLVTSESLQPAFKEVFKAHAKRYPNYGRELALREQYGGPREWWEEVIRGSFGKVLNGDNGTGGDLPEGLVQRLLDRFASKEGGVYGEDERGKEGLPHKQRFGPFERVLVGVISNSDDRVPGVLKSLGLDCGKWTWINDLDLIITSYEAGEEKPSAAIFDAAKQQAMRHAGAGSEDASQWTCVHVGDDYSKDYQAAVNAGWDGYYLPRKGKGQGHQGATAIRSLTELFTLLERLQMKDPMKAPGSNMRMATHGYIVYP
ncbi:hypothetical protein N7491_011378 [Penicillium cf. griseofulvum]|nr:hypothetical protein N7491_011378 [Penicillium cf. griseofulvum]